LADVGDVYRWDRSQLFATGALTLNDLLARIPGVTTFQSGWIASPQVAAYAGEFRRVRVFLDGFELDEVNPRAGGVQDYATIPLWTLEEVRIERSAREIRVHMRTWTTRSTTAATRVDVSTGDYDTNSYRGYYAKRFTQGILLQAGAYQYGTQDDALGDADHLALIARAGWAKGKFSVTGTYYTLGLDRAEQLRIQDVQRPSLPAQDARYTQAYGRI
ncbi:MAG: Plug domain-containing protein, partial [Gemmatimonadota bacterium]